jgi:hypothetical protein
MYGRSVSFNLLQIAAFKFLRRCESNVRSNWDVHVAKMFLNKLHTQTERWAVIQPDWQIGIKAAEEAVVVGQPTGSINFSADFDASAQLMHIAGCCEATPLITGGGYVMITIELGFHSPQKVKNY